MAELTARSRIAEVAATERGRELLLSHGYDLGEGFADVLSQYASLEHAQLEGRLRDVRGLLRELGQEEKAPATGAEAPAA